MTVYGTGTGTTLHSISRRRAQDMMSLHTKAQSANIRLLKTCRISMQARGRYLWECSVDPDAKLAVLTTGYADRLGVEYWRIREMECPWPAKNKDHGLPAMALADGRLDILVGQKIRQDLPSHIARRTY